MHRSLLLAIVEWVRVYPGDFSFPEAKEKLFSLYRYALELPHLGHQAADLAEFLPKLTAVRDMDYSWSLAARRAKQARSKPSPGGGGLLSASAHSDLDDNTREAIDAQRTLQAGHQHGSMSSARTSAATSLSPQELSILGRPSISSPPPTMSGFSGTVGSDYSRPSRPSSDGSRSYSESDLVEGRQFIKGVTLLEGLTDLAVAVELSKEEWRLFSELRVSSKDWVSLWTSLINSNSISLETACVKQWEVNGIRPFLSV